ncbi:carbohydrate ABC transporter permease [Paenibacillus thiaminolyticus]|uniref:Carbohydrate ABC transporter permease n=1 Tax=Paenibacillus thiaminolyticus TaxID=49283 RepID=A0ABT4G3D7_PANTH|nr:carbohydrate ABC transporter permease [Paenibacillus thiaminolyticus]MCY9538795.1 carbohydrate ABC transporter permease [Paenibacillus thiaminolyticus]MCY9604546.1 carbohydrate ABC transporter permease [Paenibacillus thiaminolyticus]MCY9610595.1 carbohydrate ABC transporter permease [Paenibacillus thiaminolyticus]MCY9614003.1 carbohydrate ABC transporter permease [Paenibacillus thiaminolyticus]MCY9618540.1 carbohydrate ABC transporter permease [Paenibacillus thiaminolyticus]
MRKKGKIINFIAATILGLLFLLPILWMIFTSFKTLGEAMSSSALLPKQWTAENYAGIMSDAQNSPMLLWILNTAIVTLAGTLLVVFVDVLAAYSLARLQFPGKKLLLAAVVGALTIPGIVTLFPAFYLFKSFHLLDTFVPLIFPYSAGTMGVFLVYNFLLSFPKELEEAAYLDGASQWKILTSVIFPAIRPVVTTLSVITFLGIYNDYLWPSLVVSSTEMKTITVGIASLIQGSNFVNPAKMMASTVIATLPAILIFVFTNKYFVKGVTNSGIK